MSLKLNQASYKGVSFFLSEESVVAGISAQTYTAPVTDESTGEEEQSQTTEQQGSKPPIINLDMILKDTDGDVQVQFQRLGRALNDPTEGILILNVLGTFKVKVNSPFTVKSSIGSIGKIIVSCEFVVQNAITPSITLNQSSVAVIGQGASVDVSDIFVDDYIPPANPDQRGMAVDAYTNQLTQLRREIAIFDELEDVQDLIGGFIDEASFIVNDATRYVNTIQNIIPKIIAGTTQINILLNRIERLFNVTSDRFKFIQPQSVQNQEFNDSLDISDILFKNIYLITALAIINDATFLTREEILEQRTLLTETFNDLGAPSELTDIFTSSITLLGVSATSEEIPIEISVTSVSSSSLFTFNLYESLDLLERIQVLNADIPTFFYKDVVVKALAI